MFVTSKAIRKQYDISYSTLRQWAIDGKVQYRQLPGGKRLYEASGIASLVGCPTENVREKEKIVYTRVSSSHQKEDLDRQVVHLQSVYPEHRLIKDIGSGINFRRKGLLTLLELVFKRRVSEVVVAHRDRLCRIGFDLMEHIFKEHDVKLVVQSREEGAARDELAEDLLSIVNVFVAKHNGQRAALNRKRRRLVDQDHPTQTSPRSEEYAE